MKERVRRLEKLEGRDEETDADAYERYVRGLSDEELDKRCEEIRAEVGEVAYQEMQVEVTRRMREGR